jgi:GT2 family glycosyltransferase
MADFAHDEDRRVDQIMGACMAIPRSALAHIGLLDERYWLWFEEVDWCRRAANAGREIWFTPQARVVHHGGVSFRHVLPVKKEWRFIRSGLRYAMTYLGMGSTFFLLSLVPLALFLDTSAFLSWFRRSSTVSTPTP